MIVARQVLPALLKENSFCRRLAEIYSGTFKITVSFFSIFVVILFVCLFFLKGQVQKTFRNSRDTCYSSKVPDTTAAVRDGFFSL